MTRERIRNTLVVLTAAVLLFPSGRSIAAEPGVAAPGDEVSRGAAPRELVDFVRDSYIFVFRDDVPGHEVPDRARGLAAGHGGRVTGIFTRALKGFAATLPARAAEALARNPRIAYFEPDGIAWAVKRPDGRGKPPKDNGSPPAQVTPWGIDRVCGPGFLCPDATSSTGTAWVIDTGVDLDHPDLNVDVPASANFVPTGKNSPDDGNGHGTHVAGTIAAKNDAYYVVGVVPGATVASVRVLSNSGSGAWSWVIAGIDHVAGNAFPGDVANMSLGGPANQAVDQAVLGAAALGIRFAVSAGNESDFAGKYSPARVNHPNVFTVSAVDSGDWFAWFSNFGNPPVDRAAPGVSVLSLYKGGGMQTLSGTSMAAPHVAGLLLQGRLGVSGFAAGDPDGTPDPIAHY